MKRKLRRPWFGVDRRAGIFNEPIAEVLSKPFCADEWTQQWVRAPGARERRGTAFRFDERNLESAPSFLSQATSGAWMMTAGHVFLSQSGKMQNTPPRYVVFRFDIDEMFHPESRIGKENLTRWKSSGASTPELPANASADQIAAYAAATRGRARWLLVDKNNVAKIDLDSVRGSPVFRGVRGSRLLLMVRRNFTTHR